MRMCEYMNKKCEFCCGDMPLFWIDNANNAFVDKTGDMLVTVKDKSLRFKVDFCPKCGRKFEK